MRVFAFVGIGGLLAGCAPVAVETETASEAPTGAYLGQEPPGAEAAVFAPGIVSTGMYERDIAISADGSEIYWGVVLGSYGHSLIMQVRMGEDGRWGEPSVAPEWGIDYFHLAKLDGTWTIMNVIWQTYPPEDDTTKK